MMKAIEATIKLDTSNVYPKWLMPLPVSLVYPDSKVKEIYVPAEILNKPGHLKENEFGLK